VKLGGSDIVKSGGSIQVKSATEIGIGMVEAATLEKKGPKGMRLFVSTSLQKEIPQRFQKSFKATKDRDGKDILEINWTHPDKHNTAYLNQSLKEGLVTDILAKAGHSWLTQGDKYQQDIGKSIIDLLNW